MSLNVKLVNVLATLTIGLNAYENVQNFWSGLAGNVISAISVCTNVLPTAQEI